MATRSANPEAKKHRTINLTQQQWDELERLAKTERRSLSDMARAVVDLGFAAKKALGSA